MPDSAGDAVLGHLPSVGQWDLESTSANELTNQAQEAHCISEGDPGNGHDA